MTSLSNLKLLCLNDNRRQIPTSISAVRLYTEALAIFQPLLFSFFHRWPDRTKSTVLGLGPDPGHRNSIQDPK